MVWIPSETLMALQALFEICWNVHCWQCFNKFQTLLIYIFINQQQHIKIMVLIAFHYSSTISIIRLLIIIIISLSLASENWGYDCIQIEQRNVSQRLNFGHIVIFKYPGNVQHWNLNRSFALPLLEYLHWPLVFIFSGFGNCSQTAYFFFARSFRQSKSRCWLRHVNAKSDWS